MLGCRRLFTRFPNVYLKCLRTFSSEDGAFIDLKEPAVQKYLENIRNMCKTSKAAPNLYPLANVLDARVNVLDNLKNLDELEKGSDSQMKDLVKLEREEYYSQLKSLDDDVLSLLMPSEFNYAPSDCILEVTAGVGGQEAMLFAREVFQMYLGYANQRGWSVEIHEKDGNEGGGLRHGSAAIAGPGAYETLRLEGGVHRVQRVPATEKAGRLHTSTASVTVLKTPSEIDIVINDRDLHIETKRSSGAGGQHVNTTDSCVRIVHLPSGISVECQVERNQHRNRKSAMTRLRALLYKQEEEAQFKKERNEKKSQAGSSERNEKIRTYNFNQDRVTDHRLGASLGTIHDVHGILKGGPSLHTLIQRIQRFNHKRKLLEEIDKFKTK